MSSIKRIFFGVVIGSILLLCVLLAISNFQLRAESSYLQEKTKTLHADLSYTTNRLQTLETELANFKINTTNEFESTWRSFGRVRNNFKALGNGFHLEDKDIAPDAYAMGGGE